MSNQTFMSNWTQITADDLKAAGHGMIVDKARTTASGGVDPVDSAIADAVSRVRRSVAAGNALDVDPAKIPASLRGITIRIAVFALMERIRLPLSDDQKKSREFDNSDLLRVADRKTPVEEPDVPAGNAEMQSSGGAQGINVPHRQTGRHKCSGL